MRWFAGIAFASRGHRALAWLAIAAATWSEQFGSGWEKRTELLEGSWAVDRGVLRTTGPAGTTYAAVFPVPRSGPAFSLEFELHLPAPLTCSGAYVTLAFKQSDAVIFGPDVCGDNAILQVRLASGPTRAPAPKRSPVAWPKGAAGRTRLRLSLEANGAYRIRVNGTVVDQGFVGDEWPGPPELIPDSTVRQPADWDDRPYLDANGTAPEDWPPRYLPVDPADYDEDPDLDVFVRENPAWRGAWRPPRVANPAYKGPWMAPLVPNPAFRGKPTALEDLVELRLDFFHLDTNVGFDDLALASSDSELDARAPKKAKKSKKKPEL